MLDSQHISRNIAFSSHPLFARITDDDRPLPPAASSAAEDDELLADEPYVYAPVHADYGFNIKIGIGAFINFNTTFIDTCPITIGARTLVGPNCSFYSGTHPLDPALRMGTAGPELGKPINIGEDCWLGGNVIVLPGITIGRGCSIGAGSVVTKVSDQIGTIVILTFLRRTFLTSTSLREILLEFYARSRQLWTRLKPLPVSLRMKPLRKAQRNFWPEGSLVVQYFIWKGHLWRTGIALCSKHTVLNILTETQSALSTTTTFRASTR